VPLSLSKETKLDPTRSRLITDPREAEATRLVREFLQKITDELGYTTFFHGPGVADMSALQFMRYLDRLAKSGLTEPIDPKSMITDSYLRGAVFAKSAFGSPVGVDLGLRAVARNRIGVMVESATGEFSKMSEGLTQNVRSIIAQGVVNGRDKGEVTDEIMALAESAEASARRIIRTESMKAINAGVDDQYRTDGVEYVEPLVADDDRTCPVCSPLAGRVYPLDDSPPYPLHPNCRCTKIPRIIMPGEEMPEIHLWSEEGEE